MPSGFADALLYIKRTLSLRSRLTLRNRRRRRRLRRPIKISAPIPHDSMELDVNATVGGGATYPDSGVFYLVPNKHGAGKSIVKRPARRLSSTPLNDEFDAITQGGTTSKGAPTTTRTSRKRPSLALRTTSPCVENADGFIAPPTIPKHRFDPMRAFRNSFRSRPPAQEVFSADGRQWKGKERATEDDNEKKSKVAAKAMEIREWRMGKSGSDIHRATLPARRNDYSGAPSYATKIRQTVGGVKDLFKNRRAGSSTHDRGPKPGQTYEIINRRIVETNEEKTVEISMWKEHDHGQVRPEDADRMSIYYISADDYAHEGEGNTVIEWRIAESDRSRDRPHTHTTNGHAQGPLSTSGTKMDPPQNARRTESRRKRSDNNRGLNAAPRREGTISPSTSEKDGSSDGKPSRSSTQSRRSAPLPPLPTTSSRAREKRRYKESTPIEEDLPRSPFHPTDSGSTISSIKSAPLTEFEGILSECEPSLIHIAPTLRSLGIRSVDHFRAVARLTPATRDREVKEDALKLGITVMEWAIFVDKIFTL